MSERARFTGPARGAARELPGGLTEGALLLAAAVLSLHRRRRAIAPGSDDAPAWRDERAPLHSPATCRKVLAELLGVTASRIRFDWSERTMSVEREPGTEPMLDAVWILDADRVPARVDWRFRVVARPDEVDHWHAAGHVLVTDGGRLTAAPPLLSRLRECVPLWHDLALELDVMGGGPVADSRRTRPGGGQGEVRGGAG